MTITIVITLTAVDPSDFERGCHVLVKSTFSDKSSKIPEVEGASWVGICAAINQHQHDNGSPLFDCMKALDPDGNVRPTPGHLDS